MVVAVEPAGKGSGAVGLAGVGPDVGPFVEQGPVEAFESFWASLKRELIDRHRWATRAQARRAIFAWINRYNRHRLHTSLAMVPPLEWEHAYAQQLAT
jgi:transposase InsO family protein